MSFLLGFHRFYTLKVTQMLVKVQKVLYEQLTYN